MQRPIPCLFMRGGTSHGPFFRASDLPSDIGDARSRAARRRWVRPMRGRSTASAARIRSPARSASSRKSAAPRRRPRLSVRAGLGRRSAIVDTTPNCGNMLAAVVRSPSRAASCRARGRRRRCACSCSTPAICATSHVQTPGGACDTPATRASTACPAPPRRSTSLSRHRGLGVRRAVAHRQSCVDRIDGVDVTCIDNGMPVVVMLARAISASRVTKRRDELDANDGAQASGSKSIRLAAGPLMNLGDVTKRSCPKMCLVAPRRARAATSARARSFRTTAIRRSACSAR